MRLTTNPGTSTQVIGCLRIACAKVSVAVTVSAEVSSPSTISISGIDRGRVEVVEADHLLGAQRRFADLRDRQRGGVGGEDRVAGRGRVELGEHALLDLHPLGHRLDHEVHVAEALVGGAPVDAPEDLLELGLGLLGGELALLDELAELAAG